MSPLLFPLFLPLDSKNHDFLAHFCCCQVNGMSRLGLKLICKLVV